MTIPSEIHGTKSIKNQVMSRKYFGTDGIRGTANHWPMTPEVAMRLGMAAGKYFRRGGDRRHTVVIGKDTRLSGYMIEPALVAGFTSVGMDVTLFGPLPTPGVAMMTRSLRADLGVMVSASHNSFDFNGLKLFGPDGYKLSDSIELEIEGMMDRALDDKLAMPYRLGRAKRIDDAQARYVELVKRSFPRGMRLTGLKIVVDCANGAAYKVAPAVLYELGADVYAICDEPDGFNINQHCGSTYTKLLGKAVKTHNADLGIALDGDADRCIIVDEDGKEVGGDQIIAVVARYWRNLGKLQNNTVVTTVMSNLNLERHLKENQIKIVRTQVGDRYVMEKMRQEGFNVGGEQSGHIILSEFSTTGDGLIASLQVLATMIKNDLPVSEVTNQFEPAPQKLVNIEFNETNPLEKETVKCTISQAEERLRGIGRVVVRKSGTEPLIRIMVEAEESDLLEEVVSELEDSVREAL